MSKIDLMIQQIQNFMPPSGTVTHVFFLEDVRESIEQGITALNASNGSLYWQSKREISAALMVGTT